MKTTDIAEGLGMSAHAMEQEHELQKARARVFNIAKDAIELHKLLSTLNEADGINQYILARIMLAADYVREAKDHIEFEGVLPPLDSSDPMPTVANEDCSGGATGAGSIGAVATPLGKKKMFKPIRRNK